MRDGCPASCCACCASSGSLGGFAARSADLDVHRGLSLWHRASLASSRSHSSPSVIVGTLLMGPAGRSVESLLLRVDPSSTGLPRPPTSTRRQSTRKLKLPSGTPSTPQRELALECTWQARSVRFSCPGQQCADTAHSCGKPVLHIVKTVAPSCAVRQGHLGKCKPPTPLPITQ